MAALVLVLALAVAAGLAPVPARADGPVPLPYVRGPSWWLYRSNFGPARVELQEFAPQDGARWYLWNIRVAGAFMAERLRLDWQGLFITAREYRFLGWTLARFSIDPPECVVAAPLEVGNRWQGSWQAVDPARPGQPAEGRLEGAVEALEEVSVPAGHFRAYRIRLLRTDSQGGRVQTVIWLDPQVGVVKADGLLWWPGPIGTVQRLLGLTALRVELAEIHLRPADHERPQPPGEAGAGPPGPPGSSGGPGTALPESPGARPQPAAKAPWTPAG
ncbi:MAG TPA: hypothetical protein VIL11_00060 [Limnochordales bacterium]